MSDDARNAYVAQRRASIVSTLEQVARGLPTFSGPDLLGDGEGLRVTVLTGGRPQLLAKTMVGLRALLDRLPRACLTAFLNQEDAASEALLGAGTVLKNEQGGVSSIGTGYAALARAAEGARWWLHVEDDWDMCGVEQACHLLRAAVWALDKHADVGQVRLRHWKERVLTRHMVSGRPITWSLRDGFPVAEAHWTFNPTIMRGEIASRFSNGVEGEQDAQRRVPVNTKIIQSMPGAFVHNGTANSLRATKGRGPDTHGHSV